MVIYFYFILNYFKAKGNWEELFVNYKINLKFFVKFLIFYQRVIICVYTAEYLGIKIIII